MVRGKARQSDGERDPAHKRPRDTGLPMVRIIRLHKVRNDPQRHKEVPLPGLPEDVRPPYTDSLRQQEDTDVGMDGIPVPPDGVPLTRHKRKGQQECEIDGEILASEAF